MPNRFILLFLALLLGASGAGAATVADMLAFPGTPAWSDHVQGRPASMALDPAGPSLTLTTAPYNYVWFGWGDQTRYGDEPGWRPGNSAAGNYLGLEALFSANASDWSAYLYDGSHLAEFHFAPTGCNGSLGSCYGVPGAAGVDITHAGLGGSRTTTFVPLDLTAAHSFEFLLKDGTVSYRIDGGLAYSGDAWAFNRAQPLLVVGDGTGHTLTGVGSMTLFMSTFDNAPGLAVLPDVAVIPLPPAVLLISGALGVLLLRRRSVSG